MRLLKTLDNMHHTLSIWLEIKFWQPTSKTCNSTMCEVCILPVWVCHVHSARWEDCIVHGVQCVLYRLISVYFKSKSSGNKEDFDIKSNLIYIIYFKNCPWLALDLLLTCSWHDHNLLTTLDLHLHLNGLSGALGTGAAASWAPWTHSKATI